MCLAWVMSGPRLLGLRGSMPRCGYYGMVDGGILSPPPSSQPPKRRDPSTPPPDGSYFPIHKITELEAPTRSIAVHTRMMSFRVTRRSETIDGRRRALDSGLRGPSVGLMSVMCQSSTPAARARGQVRVSETLGARNRRDPDCLAHHTQMHPPTGRFPSTRPFAQVSTNHAETAVGGCACDPRASLSPRAEDFPPPPPDPKSSPDPARAQPAPGARHELPCPPQRTPRALSAVHVSAVHANHRLYMPIISRTCR